MYKIIEIDQGSNEWHKFRSSHLGASDAPIIMGKSPWMTPEELWEIKAGFRKPQSMTAKMKRGHDLEPDARELLMSHTKRVFRPIVIESEEHYFLSASLDGITHDGEVICEIKCPNAQTHKDALNGIIPEYYMIQMQHQLMLSGAKYCHYWSYRPQEISFNQTALITIGPIVGLMQEILEKEIAFWKSLVDGDAPEGCWVFKHN